MLDTYKLLARLFGYESVDIEEMQKRGMLILLVGLTCVGGTIYSSIYILLGASGMAKATMLYIVACIINFFAFYISKNYTFFRDSSLIFIFVDSILAHYFNGGFVQSSAVVWSAMLTPLGALIFHPEKARLYFFLFLVVIATAVILDVYVDLPSEDLPQSIIMTFYLFNISTISFISFFLLYTFMRQNEEFRALINQQKEAASREKIRTKISSDLHDNVGSMLTGVAMQTEILKMHIDEKNIERFEKISALSRKAMESMRDTVWAIDSRKDTIGDLNSRILDYALELFEPLNKQVDFKTELDADLIINPDIRQAAYLISKEAFTNIAKYSDSDIIDFRLFKEENNLKLHIRDYGSIRTEPIKTSGQGLSNMKLRAEQIGGSFQYFIEDGFHVDFSFPLG